MAAQYVLHQNEEGQFTFTLKTHDGQVLLTGRTYPDKDTAMRRIMATRKLAGREKLFEFRMAPEGGAYFVIKNRRGEELAQSVLYADSLEMQKGIGRVKSTCHGAKLDDQTAEKVPGADLRRR